MPEQLSKMDCEACDANSPRITAEEERELLPQLPGWRKVEEDSEPRLRRMFAFPDFAQALAFTNRLGSLAEEHGHHPALLTEWGKVTVSWWTHSIGGLHRNDFIMAAKTDEAAQELAKAA
jgi:4a-hydroxytetrahydrobiopterin dehydratase